jgi:hypothetical protein
MPRWNSQHWPRDSNQTASGKPGGAGFVGEPDLYRIEADALAGRNVCAPLKSDRRAMALAMVKLQCSPA